MEILKAVILGIIQGITEFLPISSTGHLIIAEHLFKLDPQSFGLTFDLALHLGTLIALLWFFKNDILSLVFSKKESSFSWQTILIGTVPAAIIGLLLEHKVENSFRDPRLVAVNLIVFSILLYVADRLSKNSKKSGPISTMQAIVIGLFQALAIIPGVSRSGSTISGAMILGHNKEDSSTFAFMLSIPIVGLAAGKKLLDVATSHTQFTPDQISFFVVGFVASTITACIVIQWFMKHFRTWGFKPFIIYRIALGIVILLLIK